VATAVEEVDGKSDAEPNDESHPGLHRQTEHEREAHDHPKNGEERHQWDSKGSEPIGIGPPEDNNSQTNEDEGEQRSDICEVGK